MLSFYNCLTLIALSLCLNLTALNSLPYHSALTSLPNAREVINKRAAQFFKKPVVILKVHTRNNGYCISLAFSPLLIPVSAHAHAHAHANSTRFKFYGVIKIPFI